MSGITAGSWPDWLAAIFTSLAFLVAAFSYRRDVKTRAEAQARLTYSTVTDLQLRAPGETFSVLPNGATQGSGDAPMQYTPPSEPGGLSTATSPMAVLQVEVTVHNRSQELIGPVKVQLYDNGRKRLFETFAVLLDAVEPESKVVINMTPINHAHPGFPSVGSTIIFRDSRGAWWRRLRSEAVQRVHNDPENSAPTPTERAQYAANARMMGSEPTPDPKVSLRVHAHRWLRKRRGKSPLP